MKKRTFYILVFIIMIFTLSGCGLFKSNDKPTPDPVDSELVVKQKEIYNLAVNIGYVGTFEEWLASIKGEQGAPGTNGKNVELTIEGAYIKWRNEGDATWYELIAIESLKGPKGDTGAKGEEGAPGEDGSSDIGIENIIVNEFGELIITYTSGKTNNLGKIYNTYLVEFVDYNGYLLSVQNIVEGKDASPPEIYPKDDLHFYRWLGDYKNITSSRRIVAQYKTSDVMDISDFLELEENQTAILQGVVTSLAPYNSYSFEDETASVALRISGMTSLSFTYQVGDELKVQVKKNTYNGLIQAELVSLYEEIELVGVGRSLTSLDLNNESLTSVDLRQHQSRLIKLDNLEIINYNIDEFNNVNMQLKRSDGKTISFRWDSRLEFNNHIKLFTLSTGDIISFDGATLSWYSNSPKIMIDEAKQIIIESSAKEQFKILYLNDTHGAILNNGDELGLARIANYINNIKDDNSIFIVGGDMFQGQLISNDNRGALMIEILNELELDAFVIGNHEFDWGVDVILEYFDPNTSGIKANFPILGANVVYKDTNLRPDFIDSHVIINKGDAKIAIVGVIGDGLESSISYPRIKDYKFTDAYTAVSQTVNLIKDEVDFILVVNHGSNSIFNNKVATLPKVAAIFNGHTHQDEIQNYYNNQYQVIKSIQSGADGKMIGEVDLFFSKENLEYTLSGSSARNVRDSKYLDTADTAVEAIIQGYFEEIDALYSEIILIASRYMSQNELAQFVSRLMKEVTNSIAGFQNSGGTRNDLSSQQGITQADIYQILPFENQIIIVEIDGYSLAQLLNNSYFIQTTDVESYKVDYNQMYQIATNDYIYYHQSNQSIFSSTYDNEILFGDMYEVFCEVLFNLRDAGYTYFDTNTAILYYPD